MFICRDTQDLLGQRYAYRLLISVAENQYKYEIALRYYKQALSVFRAAVNQLYESEFLFRMFYFLLSQGQFTEAKRHLEQALVYNRELEYGFAGVGDELRASGQLYMILGDYKRAGKYLGECLMIARDNKQYGLECNCLVQLGFIACALDDKQTASRYGQQALGIALEKNDLYWQGVASLISGYR